MRQYLDLLRQCRVEGVRQTNRTGIDTLMIPGGMMQFDCVWGFPILTTKQVNFKAIVAELLGFIRGSDSAAQFRKLGTKIWDANANQNKQWLNNPNRRGEDDLGRIYGVQWRNWRKADSAYEVDQLQNALETLKNDATSRRIIVTAWNPGELDKMALPPCHLLYQFLPEQSSGKLHMCMYMRSCDMFLGVPFNISSYALLLNLVAHSLGYRPGKLTMFLADVHIYVNHLEQVQEQLKRQPTTLPMLALPSTRNKEPLQYLEQIDPDDIFLVGYEPQPPIKAPMAI